MKENLKYIFNPQSIAVIGASTTPGSAGQVTFANILLNGYRGVVYPVNIKANSVMGVKAYFSILDIPDEIDLAIIMVPAIFVPEVIEECGQKKVKGIVVISAGFKEIGERGVVLENRIKNLVQKYNITLIGPNCVGIINTEPKIKLNATFGRVMPKEGNIAFITQSGAVGLTALEYAQAEDIGLSKFISIGNKADVNENDLLEYLMEDEQTRVILLYLEDLITPLKFLEVARRVTEQAKKPILAIKSGRTPEGAKAAATHTGALAGSDEAYDAFFRQCGIIRVETVNELFDYGKAFSGQPLPKGRKVAILTNAGGMGIMATDASIRNGLKLASFSEKTKEKLKAILPPTASINNPVDVIGDADEKRYSEALKIILAEESVDAIIAIWTPTQIAETTVVANKVIEVSAKYSKPIMGCLLSLQNASEVIKILGQAKIPYYPIPETAAKALSLMSYFNEWTEKKITPVRLFEDVDKEKVLSVLEKVKQRNPPVILEPEGYEILSAYKIPTLLFALAKNEEEAARKANEIGYPCVLKIVSPDILHKTDVGGVMLDIENEEELRVKFQELLNNVKSKKPDAQIEGVLIQPMASSGIETIIGIKRDPQFGPLIVFGIGGIYVEVFRDVSFRVCPIRESSAWRMVQEIKGYKLLQGFRGKPPADIEKIVETLQRMSQLAIEFPCFLEIDINPFLVFEKGKGACALDARFLYSDKK
ncbi:MAG: acetate--CoA ligase alpha subunit [candidate division WOR-3 bacterium]